MLINFEQTELRLGLPGGDEIHGGKSTSSAAKRGFMETVDLKLNLSSSMASEKEAQATTKLEDKSSSQTPNHFAKPPSSKTQVVGWPPVRSSRKNLGAQRNGGDDGGASFVKVSMDGAPYLRKVDLKLYGSYKDLSHALAKMFSSFTIGKCESSEGIMKDFMNERKLGDVLNGSEYVPTYEDKDGDWMLVGDVPWEMFVDSCKRLRIMKESEAIGLAPRSMEKHKNRS